MSEQPLGGHMSSNNECGNSDLRGDSFGNSPHPEITYDSNISDPELVFLSEKFDTETPTRRLITSIETVLVDKLLTRSIDWSVSFNLPTSYHRLIAHKLADYYGLGHSFEYKSNELVIYFSPNQELKRPISDVAKRKVDEYTSMRKSVKVLVNPNRSNRNADDDQTPRPVEEKTYEEKKKAYIEARSRILGVPIEDCVAQFVKIERRDPEPEADREVVKIKFLEAIRNAAQSPDKDSSKK